MKGFIILVVAIIAAVVIIGGVSAIHFLNEAGINIGGEDSGSIGNILDKVSNVATSGSSDSSSDDSGNIIDNILSEEVKSNSQEGGGSYREVTYKDGGFRQYDAESGELIGSSYESDQDKLPSLE